MIRFTAILCASIFTTHAAVADSHLSDDAMLGEAAFKFCKTCHVVRDDDGNILAGSRAKAGPNLYGVFGRTAGTLDGYRYGKDMVAAGADGLVWDEESLTGYLLDPTGYLKEVLDKPSARSKMLFKIRADRKNDLTKEQVAANYAKFLLEIGPDQQIETNAESEGTTENSDEASDSDG